MRLAVQTSIANCPGCHMAYNFDEFNALKSSRENHKRPDGVRVTYRACGNCGERVGVADLEGMSRGTLWRDWEHYQRDFPETRRQPVLLGTPAEIAAYKRENRPRRNISRVLWLSVGLFAAAAAALFWRVFIWVP